MYQFTDAKWQSLTLQQQHKYCCKVVKALYESLLKQSSSDSLIHSYHIFCQRLSLSPIAKLNFESLSNRYHYHLRLAEMQWKEHNLLPSIQQNDKASTLHNPLTIHIYLDHLRSAHNVGSIIRSCEAFSLGNIYYSPQTPYADHPLVQKTAKDTEQWVQHRKIDNLEKLPRPLIAIETSKDAVSLYDFIFPKECTLALGNEEYGCSEEVLQNADILLSIPLFGRKNSLNVSNAFSAIACEVNRQLR